MPVSLILADTNSALCAAWQQTMADFDHVRVHHGRFQGAGAYDCMVSPANSYGIMDGGIDLAIAQHFPRVQGHVRNRLTEDFGGYQPVGSSTIVPTEDLEHPWLAHTPTMRVPMVLDGPLALNVYDAMRAMLAAVDVHNRASGLQPITSVLCPGLGTATGRVAPQHAAELMSLAVRHHLIGQTVSWRMAMSRDLELLLTDPANRR